jgi:hypothetical protein
VGIRLIKTTFVYLGIIRNKTVMEYDKLIRAESIVKKQSVYELQEAIENIVGDMEEDGFELQDAKDYIQVLLNEILGDQ